MKFDNSIICKTKFFITQWNANETEKLLQKTYFIFAPYNFLIFLDTLLHEPRTSEKTISKLFGNGVLVFSGELLFIQRSLVHKR